MGKESKMNRSALISKLNDSSEEELQNEVERRKKLKDKNRFQFDMSPRELCDVLNRSVIGQDDAKQKVCNAVCYHYSTLAKREELEEEEGERSINIHKNNVMLIGPTGCGKTYIVQKIARALDVPLLISDATRFSAPGYSGENVITLTQDLVSKAGGDLNLASRGIIYVDEIDKIAYGETHGTKDVGGREVQNGLLEIIEGFSDVSVRTSRSTGKVEEKERMFNTSDVLFICGGAFSDLYESLRDSASPESGKKTELEDGDYLARTDTPELLVALRKYGMIPELLGRIPILAKLNNLSKDDLKKILTNSDESVIKQYERDFASYGIDVSFDDGAYELIAEKAYERKMGARALKSVIEDALGPVKFHLPKSGIREVHVTRDTIESPLETTLSLVRNYKRNGNGRS